MRTKIKEQRTKNSKFLFAVPQSMKKMGILDKILGKSAQGGPASGGEDKVEKAEIKPKVVKAEKKDETEKKPAIKSDKPKKPARIATRDKAAKKEENQIYGVLMNPWVTEKSTVLGQFNKYVFKVRPEAGKYQIKEALEDYYGVRVIKVNIVKIKPKKRMHGRTIGYKKAYKKAIVTLQAGDSISVAEGA